MSAETSTQTESLIQVHDLCFKPVGAEQNVLKGINLEVRPGDFLLLLGPPGSGKSILSRCLNGLIPHLDEGEMTGVVTVKGMDTASHPVHEFSSIVGMVFQNPDDQIVSLKVSDEVAWGVENQGLPHEEIVRRVDQFMELLGISHLRDRLTFAISGGQKQKVSIASNLAMLQDVLILDDPTTDLDPVCKAEVVQALAHLHRDMNKTLIVIEHDLNDLIELATRVVVMDDGCVIFDAAPGELFAEHFDELVRLGINMPQHLDIAHQVEKHADRADGYVTTKEQAFAALHKYVQSHAPAPTGVTARAANGGAPVVQVRDLEFAYRAGRPVLHGLNFQIHQGEFVAIVGANGSGKSTLVNNFTGLLVPDKGDVVINGHNTRGVKIERMAEDIGYVFQNPDQQLFCGTVAEEVGFSLGLRKVSEEEISRRVGEVLETVGLAHQADRHPFSLSRGQRQKLAVATALIHHPSVMLLDEPTTGQDRHSLAGLLAMMTDLNRKGNTTIMVTHDMDIVAAYATRVIVMADGQIVLDGPPADIFYDRYETLNQLNLRPPTVVDFSRRLQDRGVPRCLTVEELAAYLKEVDECSQAGVQATH